MKKTINFLTKKISSLTLKMQLILLMLGTIFLFFLVQLNYIYQNYRGLTNVTISLVDNVLQEKVLNIESFINGMVASSQALSENSAVQDYLKNTEPSQKFVYLKPIRAFIHYILSSNDEIMNIAIIDHNGQFIYTDSSLIFNIQKYLLSHHEDYAQNDFEAFFDMVTIAENPILVYVRPVNPAFSSMHLASCITVYDNSSIQSMLYESNITQNTMLYLYDENNLILASNDFSKLNTELPEELIATKNSSFITFQKERFFVNTYPIANTQWHLSCMVPSKDIYKDIIPYIIQAVLSFTLILAILLFLSRSLWYNIAFPIYNLKAQLENIGHTGRHLRIQNPDSDNEIMQIGLTINKMLVQIEDLDKKIFHTQTKLYETEILKKEAELYALQNQINPHFLYNTLECIRDIALVYNAKEIRSIAVSMSKMFQYCMQKNQFVLVTDELDCIHNYLNIMQIRYQNRFQINIDVDPKLSQTQMLKFLLQPLIENAFYHGLERKSSGGCLDIIGKLDHSVSFIIHDTGIGIPAEKLQELILALNNNSVKPDNTKKHAGVGLYNIHHRIQLEYGAEYGLTLDSKEGEWTCVTVRFPSHG